MKRLRNIHPGEILLEEFMKPMNISQNKLARSIGVDPRTINQIVNSDRAITPVTDLLLSRFFGTSVGFWSRMQNDYDSENAKISMKDRLKNIIPYKDIEPPRCA
jgi:antitoxin HigA-1